MAEDHSTDGSGTANRNHDNHKNLYHWVYVAGISLLTGVVDFVFLWPEWHLGALLVLATWFSLVAIFEFRNSKKGLAVSVPVLLFVVALIANFFIPASGPEVEIVGTLQPGNLPTPPNGCDGMPTNLVSHDALKILIGDSAAALNGLGKIWAIGIAACNVLGIERTPQGINIEAKLYDAQGRLVATINDNTFHALSGKSYLVDRHGDLSTLAVTDQNGEEVLFVRYLNPMAVIARGVFGCPGHRIVPVRDGQPIPGLVMHSACFFNTYTAIHVP